MAKEAKKDEKSKRVKRPFEAGQKWVIDNLSAVQLDELDERNPDNDELMEFLLWCVDIGIDIKISHDSFSDSYLCAAIGAWKDFPSEGYATSGRSGRDSRDALAIVWFKLVIIADGDLSRVPTTKDIDGMRG